MEGKSGIFNIGSGRPTNVNQLFDALKEITGYQREPVHAPAIVGETRKIYLNAAKARQELGWEPTVSLAEGLEKTVAYHRTMERAL